MTFQRLFWHLNFPKTKQSDQMSETLSQPNVSNVKCLSVNSFLLCTVCKRLSTYHCATQIRCGKDQATVGVCKVKVTYFGINFNSVETKNMLSKPNMSNKSNNFYCSTHVTKIVLFQRCCHTLFFCMVGVKSQLRSSQMEFNLLN